MSGGIRLLLTIVACALATPAAAQAPAPTTAFDGKYIGVATLTSGVPECDAITSVHMTIAGGQVVIHAILLHSSGRGTFRGSLNAAGEVSASRQTKDPRAPYVNLYGTVHDNMFTGHRVHRYCDQSIEMHKVPAPTMPFDGDYAGVSRESSCQANRVPGALIIRNSVVTGGGWQGNVNPRGVLVMQNRGAMRVDGQIDNQGVIRAQGSSSDGGCTVTFVWQKK
jgi:hypothetical protein